jgi:beta-galactosidase
LYIPITFTAPANLPTPKVDGTIKLSATIGDTPLSDSFRFRVFKPSGKPTLAGSVVILDPKGDTKKMLQGLEVPASDYAGLPGGTASQLLIIGRRALDQQKLPDGLKEFVQNGGSVLIMAQDPKLVQENWGLRICGIRTRQVFPVRDGHPALGDIDAEDLRNWAGESTLTEPYPTYKQMQLKKGYGMFGIPYYGYYWGTNGVVTTAAFEKPHIGGWTPILECEFDLQYSPLMELGVGSGKVILCALDLEDHWDKDVAASELAKKILEYAASATLPPRAKNVVYVGGDKGEQILKQLGAVYHKSDHGEADADLTVVGEDGNLTVQPKGRVFLLANARKDMLTQASDFHGSVDVPEWPEARGLSPPRSAVGQRRCRGNFVRPPRFHCRRHRHPEISGGTSMTVAPCD